jgi:hypothetical protein
MTAATSSSASKNGAAAEPPAEWATWPTERQAAKQLRTSNTQLRSTCAKLGLAPVKAFDGSNRYSPDLIAEVERVLRVAEELADDEDAPPVVPTEALIMRELVAQNREQRAHIEKLLGLIVGPMTKVLESYDKHNERSERRIADLEKSRDEANEARSKELDDAQARELVRQAEVDKLERRKQLFGVVKERLPSILEAIETSLGLGIAGASREKVQAASELLRSLDPAQLAVLLDPSMTILKPEQRAWIRKMLGLEPESDPKSDAAADPATTTEKEK